MIEKKHPKEPNNWKRWGEDDEKGAANHLTPECVKSALFNPTSGQVLSLSYPIKGSTSSPAQFSVPHLKGRPLPQHFMSIDGADYCAGTKHPAGGRGIADDALMLSPHGTTTHMDALCHMWLGDSIYNGHSASKIRSYGATRCGIEKAGPIVTRGVFLDVATHRNCQVLEKNYRITVEDLESLCQAQQIDIGQGDAVVIRTGWPTVFNNDPEDYWDGEPGLSSEAGEWLAAKDITLIACDNSAISGLNNCGAADELPEDDIHMIFLWRHGIYMAEMLWLEELTSTMTAQRGTHSGTFLFIVSPLNIEGGTGSPINPIAIL